MVKVSNYKVPSNVVQLPRTTNREVLQERKDRYSDGIHAPQCVGKTQEERRCKRHTVVNCEACFSHKNQVGKLPASTREKVGRALQTIEKFEESPAVKFQNARSMYMREKSMKDNLGILTLPDSLEFARKKQIQEQNYKKRKNAKKDGSYRSGGSTPKVALSTVTKKYAAHTAVSIPMETIWKLIGILSGS